MTAEEKYEETKKKVQKLTEELPSIASKFGNSIVLMEDIYEKTFQKARDIVILGDSHTAKKTINIAVKINCYSVKFKDVQMRLNNCESALRTLGDVSFKKMGAIEKGLEAFLISCNGTNGMASSLANVEKSLCDLENVLEIDTESDKKLYEDDCSTVSDEFTKHMINDLATDSPFFEDSIASDADAFAKMMLEENENDDSSKK